MVVLPRFLLLYGASTSRRYTMGMNRFGTHLQAACRALQILTCLSYQRLFAMPPIPVPRSLMCPICLDCLESPLRDDDGYGVDGIGTVYCHRCLVEHRMQRPGLKFRDNTVRV